jgi:hypothetical protein
MLRPAALETYKAAVALVSYPGRSAEMIDAPLRE